MLLGYHYSKWACCWGISTADWHAAGQGCGAETIWFGSSSGSGSDFQQVSAPALAPTPEPAPAPTWALWVPVFTAFKWKSRFFMTFWKEYRLNSIFWSYSIWIMIKYTTWVCPGAGAGNRSRSRNFSIPAPAKSFGSGRLRLQLRLRLRNPAAWVLIQLLGNAAGVLLQQIGILLGYYYSKLAFCWGIHTANWHAAEVLIQQICMLL